jgi:hypothetical protein
MRCAASAANAVNRRPRKIDATGFEGQFDRLARRRVKSGVATVAALLRGRGAPVDWPASFHSIASLERQVARCIVGLAGSGPVGKVLRNENSGRSRQSVANRSNRSLDDGSLRSRQSCSHFLGTLRAVDVESYALSYVRSRS